MNEFKKNSIFRISKQLDKPWMNGSMLFNSFMIDVDKRSNIQRTPIELEIFVRRLRTKVRFASFVRNSSLFFLSRIDILQLAEALRILCITSRKIRTVLWYWLYWSTNSNVNPAPLFSHYQEENFSCPSINPDLFNFFDSDIHGKNSSNTFNENNKENQYNQ